MASSTKIQRRGMAKIIVRLSLLHLWLSEPQFSGDEIFYRESNGGRKSKLFPTENMPMGIVLVCNFFHSISNTDKISQQLPSGVEIIRFFSTGYDFLNNFSSVVEGPPGACDTGVFYLRLDDGEYSPSTIR